MLDIRYWILGIGEWGLDIGDWVVGEWTMDEGRGTRDDEGRKTKDGELGSGGWLFGW